MRDPAIDAEGLRRRAALLSAVRRWFAEHGYLEVPTPIVVPSPALEAELYAYPAAGGALRTSPELALKRVLAAGLPRIVEIGPCFRAREHGPWHRAEFTMCEWYRAGATLADLQREVRAIVEVARQAVGAPDPGPWRRVTVRQLVLEVTGIDLATASARDLSGHADEDWDTAFFRRWVEDVEPTLTTPTFVEAWPASQAALATVRTDGAMPVAERFEVFLGGVELANAFQELRDPGVLRSRWEHANAVRAGRGDEPHPIDEAFLSAVSVMPRSAGIALGMDRLLAALLGWKGIAAGRVDIGA